MPAQEQKPLIGITLNRDYGPDRFWLPGAYCRCVEAAGGLPILLPPLAAGAAKELLSRFQGLLFSGGGDIQPFNFGEEPQPGLGEVDPQRDAWEIRLAREALQKDLPLLGICRGLQVLNVAAGGTIVQDLSGQDHLQHMQKTPRCFPSHTVNVLPGTSLAQLAGEGHLAVNSFHHQAAGEAAPGLQAAAIAPDGVLEALESPAHRFVLAVQWHPETMDHPATASLFQALISAARK